MHFTFLEHSTVSIDWTPDRKNTLSDNFVCRNCSLCITGFFYLTSSVGGNERLLSSESFPSQTNITEFNEHNLTPSETWKILLIVIVITLIDRQ